MLKALSIKRHISIFTEKCAIQECVQATDLIVIEKCLVSTHFSRLRFKQGFVFDVKTLTKTDGKFKKNLQSVEKLIHICLAIIKEIVYKIKRKLNK